MYSVCMYTCSGIIIHVIIEYVFTDSCWRSAQNKNIRGVNFGELQKG